MTTTNLHRMAALLLLPVFTVAISNGTRQTSGGIRATAAIRRTEQDILQDSTTVMDLDLCVKLKNDAEHDQYFWISYLNSNQTELAACIVSWPEGTAEDTQVCCPVDSVAYSSSGFVRLTDPSQYCNDECGGCGSGTVITTICPYYSETDNEMSFEQVQVYGANVTVEAGHFYANADHNGCGLSDYHQADHCGYRRLLNNAIESVFPSDSSRSLQADCGYGNGCCCEYLTHLHVGYGQCLQSRTQVQSSDYGCAYYYDCEVGDC